MSADVSYANPPNYHSSPPYSHDIHDELPAYTRRRRPTRSHEPELTRTDHVYEIMGSKGKPWATLKLNSSARQFHQIPTFFEDEPITGCVDLDLEGEESIRAVTLTVKGRVVTSASTTDALTFLSYTHQVWSKAETSFAPTFTSKRNSKLHGRHSWPFSFSLPKNVTLPSPDGGARSYHLPQTFIEKYVTASVRYDITLGITRGKLRADSSTKTQIAYIPSTRPSPPSALRQLAYRENSPLLSPESDPEGWFVLQRASINAGVDVVLALAKPLCYTRGTIIPAFITLTPKTIPSHSGANLIPPQLRLLRRIKYSTQLQTSSSTETIATAVWWPAYDDCNSRGERRLYGEIALKKDLKPNTQIAHFSVEYMLALTTVGMSSSERVDTEEPPALLTKAIEIATQNAHGPHVRAYAPPRYAPEREREIDELRRTGPMLGKELPLPDVVS